MLTKKLTAIIVDDEAKARSMLQILLDEHCPTVEVLSHCKNVPEAVAAIHKLSPDIVFLDVDMPGYSGFQLLDFFEDIKFEIIFTTAFSEYALQAFRVSALDFLLKPIDIDQLIEAVTKVEKKQPSPTYNKQLDLIRESAKKLPETIAVNTNDAIVFVKLNELILCEANRSYTKLMLTNGRQFVASKNIKEFEELLLQNSMFFRAHRSFIINLNKVLRFNKTEGGNIIMEDEIEVALSKDAKVLFIDRMENI